MEKISSSISVSVGILAMITSILLISCGKKAEKTEATAKSAGLVSAEKNSFKEVTSNLNAGGDFYLYLGTEKWLQNLSASVSGMRQLFLSAPDFSEADKASVNKAFDVITRLIKNSGVEEVSGVGISSIAREKGLYYNKSMLHHYKGKTSGYLWSIFGKSSHPLNGLDFLPSTTAFASFSDLDLPMLWSTIQQEVSQAGFPEADTQLRQLPATFEMMTGSNLDQILNSSAGEIGIVITLDESKKIPLPMPTAAGLEIPEPGIMLMIKVKDDTLFNRLEQFFANNPGVIRVDQDGLKMRTMPIPLPLPIQIRATIARSGDYLFLASSDTLVQDALAVKSGKKEGLKSTAEFKRLSQGIPSQGNSFCFAGQKFGQIITEIQKAALQMSSSREPAQAKFLQQFMGAGEAAFAYSVAGNTEEGWLSSGNSNSDSSKIVLAGAVVPIGLMSAIAVPSFVRARTRAQASTILNEARQLDAAKDQYALEHNKTGPVIPAWNDLTPYLRSGSKLATGNGKDSLGNPFVIGDIQSPLKVSPQTKEKLKDATGGDTFWGPYS